MKKIFLLGLFVWLAVGAYSQQSAISITPVNPALLLVELTEGGKILHFDFSANDLTDAAQLHIQIGSAEGTFDIVNQVLTISNENGKYILSDGTTVTDNTIRVKVILNDELFQNFNFCSVFIQDTNGLNSNTLSFQK